MIELLLAPLALLEAPRVLEATAPGCQDGGPDRLEIAIVKRDIRPLHCLSELPVGLLLAGTRLCVGSAGCAHIDLTDQ